MSDWKKRAIPASDEDVAGWKSRATSANEDAPVQGNVGPLPGGYVKSVDPASEEAQLADFNTKRRAAEGASDLKIKTLEGLAAAAQTGSMNTGDQMAGILSMLKGEGYRKGQQQAEGVLVDAQQKHPIASIAGALPSLLVPGGQTIPARLAIAGLTGAASSAGATPGNASLEDTGKNALVGAGTGMALQGGAEVAGKGLKTLSGYLKNKLAPEWAVKAAGVRGGIANVPQKAGIENMDELRQLGRDALNNGLIPVAGSKEAVANEAAKLQATAGNSIGAQLAHADASGIPADFDAAQWAAIKPAMESTVLARNKSGGPVRDLLEALAQQAEETPGSYSALNATKSDMGKNVNWNAVPKGTGALVRKTYGALNNELANQVGNAAGPEVADALRKANTKYGLAKTIGGLAKDTGLREGANRSVGLSELLAALGGGGVGAVGGPGGSVLGGTLAAGAANLLRKRGPALGARVADDLGAPLAQALSSVNQAPATAGALSSSISDEDKKRLAKYLGLMGE